METAGKFSLLFVLWFALGLSRSGIAGERPLKEPYSSLSAGAWELRIFCEKVGMKSETRHGQLFKDGKAVQATQVGEVIQTGYSAPMNRLKYFGSSGETTGWYFADAQLKCGDLPR